jgi:hypothetical protein
MEAAGIEPASEAARNAEETRRLSRPSRINTLKRPPHEHDARTLAGIPQFSPSGHCPIT